jgi:hypothetical protein
VERLIGTIRREFLDHVLIWNAVDLGRKLEEFRICDLLPIEWVKTGVFLRVDADFKGFLVNLPVTG